MCQCFSDRYLLKLQSKKRTVIPVIQKYPQFYEVGGTCCWKVYAKTHHRGEGEILRAKADRQMNRFTIRSVKLMDCE